MCSYRRWRETGASTSMLRCYKFLLFIQDCGLSDMTGQTVGGCLMNATGSTVEDTSPSICTKKNGVAKTTEGRIGESNDQY